MNILEAALLSNTLTSIQHGGGALGALRCSWSDTCSVPLGGTPDAARGFAATTSRGRAASRPTGACCTASPPSQAVRSGHAMPSGTPCPSTAAGVRCRRSCASQAQARPWRPRRRPTPAAVAAAAAVEEGSGPSSSPPEGGSGAPGKGPSSKQRRDHRPPLRRALLRAAALLHAVAACGASRCALSCSRRARMAVGAGEVPRGATPAALGRRRACRPPRASTAEVEQQLPVAASRGSP